MQKSLILLFNPFLDTFSQLNSITKEQRKNGVNSSIQASNLVTPKYKINSNQINTEVKIFVKFNSIQLLFN